MQVAFARARKNSQINPTELKNTDRRLFSEVRQKRKKPCSRGKRLHKSCDQILITSQLLRAELYISITCSKIVNFNGRICSFMFLVGREKLLDSSIILYFVKTSQVETRNCRFRRRGIVFDSLTLVLFCYVLCWLLTRF